MAKVQLLEIEPIRNLKFRHLWALGVVQVVGDGIFLLIGERNCYGWTECRSGLFYCWAVSILFNDRIARKK